MNKKKGQAILEIVIALAIFSFIAMALVSLMLGSLHGGQQGSQHLEADALAQEGLEAIRSIRDGAWNELPATPSGVAISANQWIASGASNSIPPFTRTITVSDVCRTSQGDSASCPASYTDPHTKYAESRVDWTTLENTPNRVVRSSYLTNWDSSVWTQTDWVGGAGQSTWLLPNRYESDDGHALTTIAGQVQIAPNIGSGAWSLHTELPQGHHIRGVSTVSASDMWAVGDNGLIAHYNGTAWTEVSSPHGDRINAIHMLSQSDGWAVGDGGKIIHYNGTAWSSAISPATDHLNSVYFLNPSDGWAVGAAGKIFRYNGVSWSEFADTGGTEWNDVQLISATDGWMVGNQGLIYHWNGAAWAEHTDTGGTVWSALHMISALDGWAIGDQGLIYHWNGIAWSQAEDTGGNNWNAIHFSSTVHGWAVGNGGEILHWNGVSWQEATSPTTNNLRGVSALSLTSAWAVGDGSKIFRYVANAYYAQATLVSSAFSLSDSSPVTVIEWDEAVPVCTPACDVRFQVRTAPDNGGIQGVFGSWYGSAGVDTYFSDPRGSVISSAANNNRWVQYRVILDGDMQNTPTLNEVRIYYK
ncbi:MAG: hypothetical protein AAB400_03425 [Patescibacteria group bacterium]